MPNQHLTPSTTWPGTHFAGQSLTHSGVQWNQPQQTDRIPSKLISVDDAPGVRVIFSTTAEITGTSVIPASAFCRMFCHYVVSNLRGKALEDACYSLADIYSWQLEQVAEGPPRPAQGTVRAVSNVYHSEPTPFVFED